MKQKFRVEMEDGSSWEVTADGRDVRTFEASTGESFISTALTYTQLSYLAAAASIRTAQYAGSVDSFLERNVSVETLEEPAPARPTPADRTAKQSSRSRSARTSQ